MVISVCVGSSCHLKGSYNVIDEFKRLIKKYNVDDAVELQAAFCLGHCSEGVTVKINDKLVVGVSPENAEEIFVKEVYEKL